MAGRRFTGSGVKYFFKTFLADTLLVAVIILSFAYFHHVKPRSMDVQSENIRPGVQVTQQAEATPEPTSETTVTVVAAEPSLTPEAVVATATPEPTAVPTSEPTAEPYVRVGDFSQKFASRFTDGEVYEGYNDNGDYHYYGENINLTVTKGRYEGCDYYFADFYIRDIENLQSGFALGKSGERDDVEDIADYYGAILAINGDYYAMRGSGYINRNGKWYYQELFRDICVLYWNGEMKTYLMDEIPDDLTTDPNVYQVWSFGPLLIDENGDWMSSFNTDVGPENPRTVLGYYEPGHYCFVVVEGRVADSGEGIRMTNLSKLMVEELGCTAAYNLDGGRTSAMALNGAVINEREGSGRQCSDVIMLLK